MADFDGWGLRRAFLEDLANIRPLNAVGAYRGPSLVVHGTADEVVPPADASDYRAALGGHCRLHWVQGAGHVFSRLGWKSEVIEVTRGFFGEVLGTVS